MWQLRGIEPERGRKTGSQAREVDRAPRLCAIECRGYGLCTA